MLRFPKGKNHPGRLLHKYLRRAVSGTLSQQSSSVRIDLLIPALEKDLPVLEHAIRCARKYVLNPIDHVFVVGKPGVTEGFCKEHDCIFLNEEQVLPIGPGSIRMNGAQWSRSGWLFQQLIKLSADEIGQNEHVLLLDADTCLTKPQSFVLNDGKVILHFSDEYHHPYNVLLSLTGLKKRFGLSFVCHHMLVSRRILQQLKHEIEVTTGKNWIDGIIANLNFNESSNFSEYELYGNYLYYKFRDFVHIEYWNNKSINPVAISQQVINDYAGKFKSVSFHKNPG